MNEYKRQCPLDGGSCGEGGQCIVCRSEGLQIELAAAKARIAEQDKYIEQLRDYNFGLATESEQQQARIAELEATLAAIESADWTHMEEAQARIAELEEALEPLADIVTAFDEKYCDHHQNLVLMEAGDARRAAALLKEKE